MMTETVLHRCPCVQIDAKYRLTLLAGLQLCTNCPIRVLDLRGNGINPAVYVPPPLVDAAPLPQGDIPNQAHHLAQDASQEANVQPSQTGMSLYKQHLRDAAALEGGGESDRVDLWGDSQLENDDREASTRPITMQAPATLESGLSEGERVLAQSLTLSRKLQAPPRNIHVML